MIILYEQIMFQQSQILDYYLKKIQKQTVYKLNPQSAFNQALDRRLKKLIKQSHSIQYNSFLNFSINYQSQQCLTGGASQLPGPNQQKKIYSQTYKQQKQGVGQLGIRNNIYNLEEPRVKLSYLGKKQIENNKKEIRKVSNLVSQSQQEESELNNDKNGPKSPSRKAINQNNSNLEQLEKALQKAKSEQNSQHQGFFIYKPKYESLLNNRFQNLIQNLHEESSQVRVCEQTVKQDQVHQQNKNGFCEDLEYDINYSRLQEQYNHYSNLIHSYGYGYHEESATDSGTDSSSTQSNQLQIYTQPDMNEWNVTSNLQQCNTNKMEQQKNTIGTNTEANKTCQLVEQNKQRTDKKIFDNQNSLLDCKIEQQVQICELKDFYSSQQTKQIVGPRQSSDDEYSDSQIQ